MSACAPIVNVKMHDYLSRFCDLESRGSRFRDTILMDIGIKCAHIVFIEADRNRDMTKLSANAISLIKRLAAPSSKANLVHTHGLGDGDKIIASSLAKKGLVNVIKTVEESSIFKGQELITRAILTEAGIAIAAAL